MATVTANSTSTKVIRIQDDEKELLFHLRDIYGNDYKKYSEYIRRESSVPLTIKKIYKLLDERKAYRRISDYFHRERAAKKVKNAHNSGTNGSYTRSSTRGITQVPDQMSSLRADHDMDDEDELDDGEEEVHETMENDQQQLSSPTATNGSDEHNGIHHFANDASDHSQPQIRPSSVVSSSHQRKRVLPSMNHKYSLPSHSSTISPTVSEKSDLISVRSHLEKALNELDCVMAARQDYTNDEQHRFIVTGNHSLTNGHRHSKLDEIVRSLSSVVSQQQENARSIIDESSILLTNDDRKQNEEKHSEGLATSQETIIHVLERLNALIDRGNSIYDRVESILSEL